MKPKVEKPFWELSPKEQAKMLKRFDEPTDLSQARPMNKAERAQWDRARRGPVYSIRVYSGRLKSFTVRLDEELLRWSNRYAKKHRMTRDELIAKSLIAARSFAAE